MRRALLILALAAGVCQATEAWRDSNYPYRIEIVIDNANIDAALTAFPVLVRFDLADEVSKSNWSDDRYVFYDSSGTLLTHEQEDYSDGGAFLGLATWVACDLNGDANSATDDSIWVYFGYDGGAQSGDPWDANFVGVYHLNGGWTDSSGNGHDLSGGSGISLGDPSSDTGGAVAGCYSFTAAQTDCLYFNEASPMGISGAAFTIEAWHKMPQNVAYQTVAWLGDKDSTQDYWSLTPQGTSGTDPLFWTARDVSSANATTANGWGDDTWSYSVGQEIASNSRRAILDWDTANEGTDTTASTPDGADRFGIGAYLDQSPAGYWDGEIDEVRVTTGTARSDAWHKFTYNNISQGDSEITIGSVENRPAAGGDGWRFMIHQRIRRQ